MILGINLDIDGKEQTISLDSARALYFELGKLFGNTNVNTNINTNVSPKNVPNQNTRSIDKKIETPTNKKVEAEKIDKYANPVVEAARERAAKRTSGCGARR